MLQNAFQHFTRQSWESMALFQQVLDVKGEYGGGGSCWEKAQLNRPRSHCTRKVYLTYRMSLLPFLTVLATFVSRALLNLLFLTTCQLSGFCLKALPPISDLIYVRVGNLSLWFSREYFWYNQLSPSGNILSLRVNPPSCGKRTDGSCPGLVLHPHI